MKINEIFYSLQGEGYYTGTPAVFVRFSGCNLSCPFCDTLDRIGGDLTEGEIVEEVKRHPARMVVITGGEPSLQLTTSLVRSLHRANRYVAVETNGTHHLPSSVDWITLSPKEAYVGEKGRLRLSIVDELKVVYDGEKDPEKYSDVVVTHGRFLQPCDTGNATRNAEIIRKAVEYVMMHPEWRLSFQVHKYLNIK